MRHTNWHFFSIMPLCLLLSEGLLSLGWAFIPLYITQWDETFMRAQTLCHGIVRANSKIGFKCHCCILSKKNLLPCTTGCLTLVFIYSVWIISSLKASLKPFPSMQSIFIF